MGNLQASFVTGDIGKNFPLFPEGSNDVMFGYGNWPDTLENRDTIAKILDDRKKIQVGIDEGMAQTKLFIDNLLLSRIK